MVLSDGKGIVDTPAIRHFMTDLRRFSSAFRLNFILSISIVAAFFKTLIDISPSVQVATPRRWRSELLRVLCKNVSYFLFMDPYALVMGNVPLDNYPFVSFNILAIILGRTAIHGREPFLLDNDYSQYVVDLDSLFSGDGECS